MSVGVVPTGLAILLLSIVKLGDAQTQLFIQILALISCLRVAHTLYNVPRLALGLELCRGYHERNVLWSSNNNADVVGIGTGLGLVLFLFLSDWNDIEGDTWSAVWLSVVSIGYASHSTQRMRHIEIESNLQEKQNSHASIKNLLHELGSLIRNNSRLALFFSVLFFNITGGLFGGSYTYLNDYLWLWKPNELASTGFFTQPDSVAAAFYVMSITKRFDDKKR